MSIYLITGGARSGKSTYAENLALKLCKDSSRRCYIATAEAFDDEMRERIRLHQERRADKFFTVEAPIELSKAVTDVCESKKADVILIDCLTVWTGNLLYHERLEEKEKLLFSYDVPCVEMESAELFTVAARHKVQALSVLTVSDMIFEDKAVSAKEREQSFTRMMEIALEAI